VHAEASNNMRTVFIHDQWWTNPVEDDSAWVRGMTCTLSGGHEWKDNHDWTRECVKCGSIQYYDY
jgi:hypothetical protein